jgi:hypothetical protein
MCKSFTKSLRWASISVIWAGLVINHVGCGGGASIGGLVPVTGTVTLDGQPLTGAQVVFVPAGEGARACSGTSDSTGKYALITNTDKGAMPGSYKVTVSHLVGLDGKPITKFEEGMDITQLEASGQVKQNLPTKYSDSQQTELKFEVKAGKNEYNIDMKKG